MYDEEYKSHQCLVSPRLGICSQALGSISTLNRAVETYNMAFLGYSLAALAVAITPLAAEPYNTFDGEGFAACHDVASVHAATSVDDIVSVVKQAAADGTPVRASGKGHMW